MSSLKLIAAIAYLKLNMLNPGDTITMIEFEDGSGNKFNYRTVVTGLKYIDLTGKI